MMRCPVCGGALEPMVIDTIAVDVCRGGCAGVWFDNHELPKVDERHESAGECLLDLERDRSITVDHTRRRTCPRCEDQIMMRHFFSVRMEVEVDECPACGGIWLDQGELSRIRDEYESQGDRKKAARAYFQELFGAELEAMRAESREKAERAERFARVFKFICPSYWIRGKQPWGAF